MNYGDEIEASATGVVVVLDDCDYRCWSELRRVAEAPSRGDRVRRRVRAALLPLLVALFTMFLVLLILSDPALWANWSH